MPTQNIQEERPTETVDGIKPSMRNCRSCIHVPVCEVYRTLVRSMNEAEKTFGDIVDISVIHNKNNSFIDMLAKSCTQYKSPVTDEVGGI